MAFTAGISGNPAGRPKKLLKRVDEVLFERGIEPVAYVLDRITKLERTRGKRAFDAKLQALRFWMELLPYVYAKPKELSELADDLSKVPSQELAKRLLEAVPDIEKMARTG